MRLEVLAAGEWPATAAERLAAHPARRICVPTGATPQPLYTELAGRGGLPLADLFLLDEFVGLPPGHPSRCDEVIRRELLDRLAVPPASFDRIDVDAPDLDAECARYDSAVAALDLALLGLGRNGHVGLNEPGSAADSPTRVVRLHEATRRAYGPDAPTRGATIGMRALLAAREVWLLVTGAHKAAILDEVLNGPITVDVPASLLRTHPAAVALVDDAAVPR